MYSLGSIFFLFLFLFFLYNKTIIGRFGVIPLPLRKNCVIYVVSGDKKGRRTGVLSISNPFIDDSPFLADAIPHQSTSLPLLGH